MEQQPAQNRVSALTLLLSQVTLEHFPAVPAQPPSEVNILIPLMAHSSSPALPGLWQGSSIMPGFGERVSRSHPQPSRGQEVGLCFQVLIKA